MHSTYTGTDKPTLGLLNSYVRDEIAPEWYEFGKRLLKVEYLDKLNNIAKENADDKEQCCAEMLQYWLEVDNEANWNKLTDALEQTGQEILATKVKEIMQGIYHYLSFYMLLTVCKCRITKFS